MLREFFFTDEVIEGHLDYESLDVDHVSAIDPFPITVFFRNDGIVGSFLRRHDGGYCAWYILVDKPLTVDVVQKALLNHLNKDAEVFNAKKVEAAVLLQPAIEG